jgi:hypothetical protein
MHISWQMKAIANSTGMSGTKNPSPYWAPSAA